MITCIALALAAVAGAAGDAAAPLSYRTFATLATVNSCQLETELCQHYRASSQACEARQAVCLSCLGPRQSLKFVRLTLAC